MPKSEQATQETFATEFLKHYLKNGAGAMSKSDVDALVMHLLDKYSTSLGARLNSFPNQVVSERLRTPLAKVKRLRYEAALKYGPRPEDEGRRRFMNCIASAGLEFADGTTKVDKIVFIIEDTLAKNWIQGQIKVHRGVFDGSFNSELIKVEPKSFFLMLRSIIGKPEATVLEAKYDDLASRKTRDEVVKGFKTVALEIVKGAASAGVTVMASALVPLPIIGG